MLNEKDKKQRFKYAKQMRRQLQLYLVIPTSGKRSAYEPSGPLGRSLSRFPSREALESISTPPWVGC